MPAGGMSMCAVRQSPPEPAEAMSRSSSAMRTACVAASFPAPEQQTQHNCRRTGAILPQPMPVPDLHAPSLFSPWTCTRRKPCARHLCGHTFQTSQPAGRCLQARPDTCPPVSSPRPPGLRHCLMLPAPARTFRLSAHCKGTALPGRSKTAGIPSTRTVSQAPGAFRTPSKAHAGSSPAMVSPPRANFFQNKS